jgi:hypothetical protein
LGNQTRGCHDGRFAQRNLPPVPQDINLSGARIADA